MKSASVLSKSCNTNIYFIQECFGDNFKFKFRENLNTLKYSQPISTHKIKYVT